MSRLSRSRKNRQKYIALQCVIRNWDFLSFIKNATPKQRKAIISVITPDQLRALHEIAENAVYGKVKFPHHVKRTLSRHRRKIIKLAKSKNNNDRRDAIQSGGFLPILLKPILGGIAGVLGAMTSAAASR